MITGVPSLQRYLQECWVGISPAPSDGFLFSVGGGPSPREGKAILVVAFHMPIWAPILDYDQVLHEGPRDPPGPHSQDDPTGVFHAS